MAVGASPCLVASSLAASITPRRAHHTAVGSAPDAAASPIARPTPTTPFDFSVDCAVCRPGHSALVHTAAASQLGQMMVRTCMTDGTPLVNVVRRPAQEELLRSINPSSVIVSQASETFADDLAAA